MRGSKTRFTGGPKNDLGGDVKLQPFFKEGGLNLYEFFFNIDFQLELCFLWFFKGGWKNILRGGLKFLSFFREGVRTERLRFPHLLCLLHIRA